MDPTGQDAKSAMHVTCRRPRRMADTPVRLGRSTLSVQLLELMTAAADLPVGVEASV